MNTLTKISALTLIVLSLGTTVTFAQTQPEFNSNPRLTQTDPSNPNKPNRGQGKIYEQLNLTPEQQQRMQALRAENKDKMSSIKQSLRQAKEEMNSLMAGNSDPNAIRQKHQQIQQLQQQLGEIRFENSLKMREILTPEQRTKLAELKQQRRQNRPNNLNRNSNS